MNIQIDHIGKSADDLRFFILLDGQHAGGITVHSVKPPQFSYGVAIAKEAAFYHLRVMMTLR